ncbi:MAG: hypothetical protein KDB22_07305 [Planctomycetales bacterium]|nr:hypothetical protein [Planctomycetales bacterium]
MLDNNAVLLQLDEHSISVAIDLSCLAYRAALVHQAMGTTFACCETINLIASLHPT